MTKSEGVGYGILGVVCAVAAVHIFVASPKEGTVAHYIEHCNEADGEWVYGASEPTCLRADGVKMLFDQQQHGFAQLRHHSQGTAPEPIVAAAATEADCGALNLDFASYPATEPFLDSSTRADFSTQPEAGQHRTAIGRDVARGVNFAGHYVLAEWGCGDGCYGMAVVDAQSGAVQGYGAKSTQLFSYQKDSRLIGSNTANGLAYFVLGEDGKLSQICSR